MKEKTRTQTINDDMVVSMEYVLRSQTGREIEESDGAVAFIQGHGQVVPGLEEALYGMGVGEEKEVVVAPAEGYGEYDEENVEQTPRDNFPADFDLRLGQAIRLRDRETGEEFRAHVVGLDDEHVTLDYNHSLAGQTLHFHVKIVDLRPATEEELEQGFA